MNIIRLSSACLLLTLLTAAAVTQAPTKGTRPGCLGCHQGIAPIREAGSAMLAQVNALSKRMGDPDGCVACHGGDASKDEKESAHRGTFFFPDPGSPWVNAKTCGLCHPKHVAVQWNSLMMTEAGKIQGVAWAFGSLEGYHHGWGNYDTENPKDPGARLGTATYRAYKERLKAAEPQVYPDKLVTVPEAPTDLSVLKDHPEQAAFTYLRNQCQRCHWAVEGRQARGDYRGMGCSACHVPYGNEGRYEGKDPCTPTDKPGHILVHTLQSTRKAKVTVNGKTYSGIPVETCTTCHDRGKRIGVSFQGLMESSYVSPWTEGGKGQTALHTKHYIAMQEDIHYQKGMMCQDCHSTFDVHGDGFLSCANLAAVEIECADCHGTPTHYPWELPIGYQDEIAAVDPKAPQRGTASHLTPPQDQGTVYPPEDGYLLTARGNPFPEVTRRGQTVVVHTAGGKDLVLKPLKLLAREAELDTAGRVAMVSVDRHLDRMECYACHATWTPQCYGCHVKIDYSGGKRCFDWVAAGHRHADPKHRADPGERGYDTTIPGRVTEQRSYLRWEHPMLAVNGEHRVTPAAPGCQVSATVIGANGETHALNRIFRTQPNSEGAGPEGQLGIDVSPGQPHTNGRARSCESCHANPKALGHGIDGGRMMRPWDKPTVVDLMTADGQVLTRNARNQIEAIEGLVADWSRIVTEDGKQLQTVGHHFKDSRPLNNAERANMSREGVCLSCHQEIPADSLAVSVLHHIAEATGQIPRTPAEHDGLVNKVVLFAAWGQVGGLVLGPLAVLAAGGWWIRRRRRRRAGEG